MNPSRATSVNRSAHAMYPRAMIGRRSSIPALKSRAREGRSPHLYPESASDATRARASRSPRRRATTSNPRPRPRLLAPVPLDRAIRLDATRLDAIPRRIRAEKNIARASRGRSGSRAVVASTNAGLDWDSADSRRDDDVSSLTHGRVMTRHSSPRRIGLATTRMRMRATPGASSRPRARARVSNDARLASRAPRSTSRDRVSRVGVGGSSRARARDARARRRRRLARGRRRRARCDERRRREGRLGERVARERRRGERSEVSARDVFPILPT